MIGRAVAPPEETVPFHTEREPGEVKRRDVPELVLRKLEQVQVDLPGFRDLAARPIPEEDLEDG